MNMLAVGFWGAFFGAAGLCLVAALLAFTGSARRVAITGALAALLSAAYALVFLGWIPVSDVALLRRLQALTAIATAAVLALLLFALLGTFREREARRRVRLVVAVLAAVAFAAAWLLPAADALELAVLIDVAVALSAMGVSVTSASRGERAGWLALAALPCVCVGVAVLAWYAFHPENTPWQLHALSAIGGIAYLLCIATAMWIRYAYLIEVSKVMTHGPNFDPVTSMPAYETGRPPGDAFAPAEGRPNGVIVVSISNLKMLEELHGRAAYNHALFVCASRLRRMALPGAELSRLPEDGFLLLLRNPPDPNQMVKYARLVFQRLSRGVALGITRDITALEASRDTWEASVGVGLLIAASGEAFELAIAGARAMSRTAWGYPSRMAWYDEASQQIAELPTAD
ncbi:MAG: hypothetical protein JWO05_1662 [Gemmatimonadetes bacterium]|nr:hypothetical protein [Gemmatimonadota bacterium]